MTPLPKFVKRFPLLAHGWLLFHSCPFMSICGCFGGPNWSRDGTSAFRFSGFFRISDFGFRISNYVQHA